MHGVFERMWTFSESTSVWWEFVVRAVIVYLFLILMLRLSGKRQIGQLAPFDLVLLLVLSNSVQNAMNAGDNSVTAGMLSAATLIGLNYLVSLATFYNKRIAALVEGRPQVLIHNGRIDEAMLRREKLTHHELNAALRSAGCACVEDVHFAILETNGQITVHAREKGADRT